MELRGVFPPIPTPFDREERLDRAALQRNLRWLDGYALSGVVVLGSNGEAVHLTADEQARVIAWTREFLPDERLLIAGASAFSTQATIDATKRAAAHGADAALVLPPYYYKRQLTSEALTTYFTTVADAAPIPLVLYNMPGNTGIDLDAETVLRTCVHDNVIGLKDSGGNTAKFSQIVGEAPADFRILAGSAGFLLPALAVGAVGGVLALANIAPDLCLAIVALHASERAQEAARLQARIAKLNRAVTRQFGVPGLKAAMDRIGLYGGPPRAPLSALAADHERVIADLLHAAGLLDDTEGSYEWKNARC